MNGRGSRKGLRKAYHFVGIFSIKKMPFHVNDNIDTRVWTKTGQILDENWAYIGQSLDIG